MKTLTIWLKLCIVSLAAGSLGAAVELPALFSDGMVLQRDRQLPVWGWGPAGDAVTVSFGDQVLTGEVGEDGAFQLELQPLVASAVSRVLTIKVGAKTFEIQDVVVGEVWVCSGQSNMQWSIEATCVAARDPADESIVAYNVAELESHFDPLIRQIQTPRRVSYKDELNNFEGSWVAADSVDSKKGFTAVGYHFAKQLRAELDVPVGLLLCAWGGRPIQPFIPLSQYRQNDELSTYYDRRREALEADMDVFDPVAAQGEYEDKMEVWKERAAKARAAGKKIPRRPPAPEAPENNSRLPITLWNTMVHPLVPYGIRGALWYQGESNAGSNVASSNGPSYETYLRALMDGWRDHWGQGDFPFYYCQLANYKAPVTDPVDEDGWVNVCNDMRLALSHANAGMAVLNDIGVEKDIHPRNKEDVGKRLALWALAKDYGRDIVYSGPLYREHAVDGSQVTLVFDSVGEGLMVGAKEGMAATVPADAELGGFQICGADGAWKWAEATITGVDTVVVSHPEISQPVEVRYAWAQNPVQANLYNKAGLPTSVFTTKE